MIEYPSIIGPSKAPKLPCMAFEKYDGSNIRVKYTAKNGFTIFGSRREFIDEKHPHLGQIIEVFNKTHAEELTKIFQKHYRDEKELTVFGEFHGPNSFAGLHVPDDIKTFTMFDVLLVKKGNSKFIPPREFVKTFSDKVETAEMLYDGNLNEEFITKVQNGYYTLGEGVVCKGHTSNGAYRGNVWMAKIKTFAYLQRLKDRYGDDWEKYT